MGEGVGSQSLEMGPAFKKNNQTVRSSLLSVGFASRPAADDLRWTPTDDGRLYKNNKHPPFPGTRSAEHRSSYERLRVAKLSTRAASVTKSRCSNTDTCSPWGELWWLPGYAQTENRLRLSGAPLAPIPEFAALDRELCVRGSSRSAGMT